MSRRRRRRFSILIPDLLACGQNGTTREVVNQLRAISTQQSRIRALRDRMAGLKAVTIRQAENFAELLLVRRIPAAYRQALCEVARR